MGHRDNGNKMNVSHLLLQKQCIYRKTGPEVSQ